MVRCADNVMRPGKGDALSIRRVSQTEEDRKENLEAFREQKKLEKEQKERRFAEIQTRRKGKPSGSGGSGGGINIEVTSDH